MTADDQNTPAGLSIKLVNANLAFIPRPLILGHYESSVLTGAESVLDRILGGALQAALNVGRYPDRPGIAQVFINKGVNQENPLQSPRPEAVVVVGLGDEGDLDPRQLALAVCQGVIAWAQRRAEEPERAAAPFEMAATLLGSGGVGTDVAQSARQILRGALLANRRLAGVNLEGLHSLDIVELYLERAGEAWRALHEEQAAMPKDWSLAPTIEVGSGGLLRPLDASYRGTTYDLVTARTQKSPDGLEGIAFVVDTRRARSEVHARTAQLPLIRDLVKSGTRDLGDSSVGRTLFRLLVPPGMEAFFASQTDTVIQVDAGTAGIPWEMMDAQADSDGGEPWSIRARVLRKFQTASFRPQIKSSNGPTRALVIGEPATPDPVKYPPLPSARAEAAAVAGLLEKVVGEFEVQRLFSPEPGAPGASAGSVIRHLYEDDWRIIHISGHGEPPEEAQKDSTTGQLRPARRRGVVLSKGFFLGPDEMAGLPVVPELVFVSCCYLGKRPEGELLAPPAEEDSGFDRPRLAASLAESLIAMGVRCVVAAGWDVKDDAAQAFGLTFYDRLVNERPFIEAVAEARKAARAKDPQSLTWAAFQCYGDPNWTLRRAAGEGTTETPKPGAVFSQVASSAALILALNELALNSQYSPKPQSNLRESLEYLEGKFGEVWGGMGAVAEAFAGAWAECDRSKALRWYERAVAASDGRATFRAAEQLGNLRVRMGERRAATSNGSGPEIDKARGEITSGLTLIDHLETIEPTSERASLRASALKRLALVEGLALPVAPERKVGPVEGAERHALEQMRAAYNEAAERARNQKTLDLFYSALNGLAADLILGFGQPGWDGLDGRLVDEIRENLNAKRHKDPDFWSSIGLIELCLYELLSRSGLADGRQALEKEYKDLRARVTSDWRWNSPRDQLRLLFSGRRPWSEKERQAGEALLGVVDGFFAAKSG